VKKRIEELLNLRKPFYEKADFSVDTSTLSSEEVVEKIVEFLEKKKSISQSQNENN